MEVEVQEASSLFSLSHPNILVELHPPLSPRYSRRGAGLRHSRGPRPRAPPPHPCYIHVMSERWEIPEIFPHSWKKRPEQPHDEMIIINITIMKPAFLLSLLLVVVVLLV